MQYKKAVEVIGFNKLRVRAIGFMSFPVFLGIGIIGSIKWKWYALPLAMFTGWLLGNVFSFFMIKRMKKITGLDLNSQIIAYHESLACRQHPIAKDYRAYRSLIESMADEEDSAWPTYEGSNDDNG
ncbi:MAG TPA: hypothetical protein P5119_06770 [Candidatus Aminicenantes bacterium]|nr:hypothetical protein [Candidatus Aminicenantes bacterium]HRY65031.1 hypothetical protein [Candidatus Aminicenantes bacterium]HRZ71944.1 hypothetical protein [Candidatus Aminicenantes bacterium]